jgi:hypothetical protein
MPCSRVSASARQRAGSGQNERKQVEEFRQPVPRLLRAEALHLQLAGRRYEFASDLPEEHAVGGALDQVQRFPLAE